MAEKSKEQSLRERLASSIAAALPDEGGSYEISSMFTEKNRKKILGSWEVTEHTVGGIPFLDAFILKTLKGMELISPLYSSVYEFKESICIKKNTVAGILNHPNGEMMFKYVLNVSLTWQLEPGGIRVRPELGYQYSSLEDEPAAVRELPHTDTWIRILLSVNKNTMEMKEGEDVKRLTKVSP